MKYLPQRGRRDPVHEMTYPQAPENHDCPKKGHPTPSSTYRRCDCAVGRGGDPGQPETAPRAQQLFDCSVGCHPTPPNSDLGDDRGPSVKTFMSTDYPDDCRAGRGDGPGDGPGEPEKSPAALPITDHSCGRLTAHGDVSCQPEKTPPPILISTERHGIRRAGHDDDPGQPTMTPVGTDRLGYRRAGHGDGPGEPGKSPPALPRTDHSCGRLTAHGDVPCQPEKTPPPILSSAERLGNRRAGHGDDPGELGETPVCTDRSGYCVSARGCDPGELRKTPVVTDRLGYRRAGHGDDPGELGKTPVCTDCSGGQHAGRGDYTGQPVKTLPALPSTGRTGDNGTGRCDDSGYSEKTSPNNGRDNDGRLDDPQSNTPDTHSCVKKEKQPLRDVLFGRDHKTYLPMKPRPLQRLLVWLLVLTVATPFINAQYTEMIAWISGSSTANAGVGPGNSYPSARESFVSFYDPTFKFLHLFGGYIGGGYYNDFWNYNLTSDTWTLLSSGASLTANNAGTYGTIGQEGSTFLPRARRLSGHVYDPQSRCYFVFGGNGLSGRLSDLWRYNVTAKTWVLLSGSSTVNQVGIIPTSASLYGTENSTYIPGARDGSMFVYDPQGQSLFLYGGYGYSRTNQYNLDELWCFNLTSRQWAFVSGTIDATSLPVYGTRGVPSSSSYPGSRTSGSSFFDPNRRSFFVAFGDSPVGKRNDLWRYNLTDGRWSWISGSNGSVAAELNAPFPALGKEASQPAPKARLLAAWYYNASTSNFFCYGGQASAGHMGDIWRFNLDTLNWSFIGGKTATALTPTFGTRGVEATTNSMGTNYGAGLFQDGDRLYLSTGYSALYWFSAIMSSRVICPTTQYWSDFLCYNCTGNMVPQVIEGRSSCVACPANFTCSDGMLLCDPGFTPMGLDCVACGIGTYKNLYGSQACTSCPNGSFADGFGNQACTSCLSGSFASGSGNQACTSCPIGSFAIGSGNHACTSCPSGSFASGTGSQACTTCPNGSYSDIPGKSSCMPCPPSATCDTSSFTCNPGYFKNNNTNCALCPADTFKEAAGNDVSACFNCPSNYGTCNSTTLLCNRGFERLGVLCLACSNTPSKYKPLIGNEACSLCPTGATCNSTDFTCLEGYYQTASNCSTCPVNMYKSVKSNAACLDCPVGASCANPTTFVCQAGYKKTGNNCSVVTGAFYKPTAGNVEPIQCPAGAFCNATDFTCGAGYYQSGSVCLPCDSNTFKSFDGNFDSCLPCPEAATCTRTDFTCSSGYYRTTYNCSSCPANMYKAASGNEECLACPANATCDSTSFTCDAGVFRNGTSCLPCITGSYKSSSGNVDCTNCPNNAVCNKTTFTCNAGFFAAGSVCSPCAPGYFKPEPSNDLCSMCPVDSTCNRTKYQCNAGYFQLTGGCSACSSGFYKPSVGNKDCLVCPDHASCDKVSFSCSAGYFQNGSSCSPCQAGTYSDKIGSKSCLVCPNYATCNTTSFSCQSGFYKRESSCTICPRGTFLGTDGTCFDCPSNSLCESDTFFCNPGYTQLRKECIPCTSGKYKGFTGNEACLDCPDGAVCNGTHFTCSPGNQPLLGACTTCPSNSFKPSIGNTSCLACPPGATCSGTTITACPSGYQPAGLDCQAVTKEDTKTTSWLENPMFIAILAGAGGLLCVAGLVVAIAVVRSRSQTKLAMEAKNRATRAESALTQMSMNQMGSAFNASLARGGTLSGFTQDGAFNPFAQDGAFNPFALGGTFNPFSQGGTLNPFAQGGTFNPFAQGGGTFNGLTQGGYAITMTGMFPSARATPSLARNSMADGTMLYGQQTAFGTAFPTTFDQFGKTYVSQTPDFLEVVEDKDYHRIEKISEGAMGEVWLSHASQPALVQRGDSFSCVAKVVKSHAQISWESFQQEVTISWHIREHANIAQVVGFSRTPFAILLSYYPKGSLEGLIYNCQVQNFEWSSMCCCSLATDIGRGLSHMHKLSVAHCDIKPANILLKLEKGSLKALLSDFGISRILDGQALAVAGFQTHNLDGASIRYASPDTITRFRSGGDVSVNQSPQVIKAGDVYSLAVVVCEMLTRKKPWSGE